MIILDLETTGFNPRTDSIIEVGLIKIDNKYQELGHFDSLIRPLSPIPSLVERLTGITNKMIESAPRWSEIREKVRDFIGKDRIIAWNAPFDRNMLGSQDERFGCFTFIDYLKYMRGLEYDFPNYKLSTVAKFSGVKVTDAHRALGDAYLILGIMRKFGCTS